MRTLSPGFAAHIAGGATTLATCWRIVRTDDVALGFTDHDQPVTFDGTIFDPVFGAEGSEAAAKLGPQTDTSEILAVLDSEAISEKDILLGRYDRARVETWRVNWTDPDQRELLRADTIGEITREDGVFRAELRSAQQAANLRQGRIYQSVCGTSLGTSPCGIDLDNPAYRAAGSVVSVADGAVTVSGLSGFADDWFSHGSLEWTSGERDGVRDGIRAHRHENGADRLSFDSDIAEWLAPGDTFVAYAGCDRRFATCRQKFANQANFRGFPHIPGGDFVLKYPMPGDALNGAPLVK